MPAIVGALLLAALPAVIACSTPDPSCRALQEYFDDCCYTCGAASAGDTYCAYDALHDGEASCAAELEDWDLSICNCGGR